MAITPLTGFKAFTFDGEKSTDYGVAILGEGVFNAPERDVEMITIPGRSGQFALDNGRFENIEVTYPANLIADSAADFAEALSDFRNMLCSKKGYVRLQDDYHPNEYRMAVYKEGLEVNEKVLRAGEFKITFDCKPQRWLTSGESAVTIANSGDTITNPTLFESSPLLEVTGYGTIEFNGYDISLNDASVGEVEVIPQGTTTATNSAYIDMVNTSLVNNGDTISLSLSVNATMRPKSIGSSGSDATDVDHITSVSDSLSGTVTNYNIRRSTYGIATRYLALSTTYPTLELEFGTSSTVVNKTTVAGVLTPRSGSAVTFAHQYLETTVSYDATNNKIHIQIECGANSGEDEYFTNPASARGYESTKLNYNATADSTKTYLGNPTYIDCDIGEAYRVDGTEVTSLNAYIDLGSDLPTLAPGTNTVTYDNTITELNIAPRWWKI